MLVVEVIRKSKVTQSLVDILASSPPFQYTFYWIKERNVNMYKRKK
jgi:hypothetical protein